MFPPSFLPLPGELLLVTDELLSPADFLLHRFLISHLKDSKLSKSLLISVSEDIGRWKTIAGKSNVSLAAYLDSGRLTIINAMPSVDFTTTTDSAPQSMLRELCTRVEIALSKFESSTNESAMVILDDLSSLEWFGISVEDVVRFTRALCALCRKSNAPLVIRHHIIKQAGEPEELLKRLLQLCAYHLDVFPLSSGRSGSVSGQIALHAGPSTSNPASVLVPRHAAVQYRLTDSGSTFFDRGTGHGVL